ncbi:MAG TPA: FISUMP domain-containing protein [Bacteroidales bacterium]|nr:FISUMP domain-containing protein [Bacteroidales bacterium]
MKKFTLPIAIQLIGLMLMAITISAQEQNSSFSSANPEKMDQTNEQSAQPLNALQKRQFELIGNNIYRLQETQEQNMSEARTSQKRRQQGNYIVPVLNITFMDNAVWSNSENETTRLDTASKETKEECEIYISCPWDIYYSSDPGECGAWVGYLGDPDVLATCGIADVWNDAWDYFPIGPTVVTWCAMDVEGNIACCEQLVVVTDDELPIIACPPDIEQMADPGEDYATITDLGDPATWDNCWVCCFGNNAPANNQYPIGTTLVTWDVSDVNGNYDYCEQLVTVTPSSPSMFAGIDATINAGESYLLTDAQATNANGFLWSTAGDGVFNEATVLNPEYTPGTDDMVVGVVELCITGFNNNGEDTDCLELTILGYVSDSINLDQGWAGISSNIDPFDHDVSAMMAAIADQLIVLRDFQGNQYQPANKNLTNWDFTKGYFIKMSSSANVVIEGIYPLSKQLDLQQGWNLIPVLNDEAVDIEDHFYGNLDKVEIITEVAGVKVFWPDKEIATLQQLNPGKAYLVKTKAPFALSKLPEVTTAPVTEITAFSAISGGEVTDEGSSSVTDRGVVWSVSPNPTLAQHEGITSNGTGAGAWVSEVTELLSGRTYFLRAYATNSVGTSYGQELNFTTLWECGNPLFDSRDGQAYATLQIGDQCWMAENLKYLPSVGGPGTGSNMAPYYYVYGYNGTNVSAAKTTSNYQTFGVLYNWPASLAACPTGWHLPSDTEWTALTTYVSAQPEYLCNSNTSYIAKALAANTIWSSSSTFCAVGNNISANNATGFSGLPGGGRYGYGYFSDVGSFGYFWSSTEFFSSNAWLRTLTYYNAYVLRLNNDKGYGFSVRCLRD